MSEAQKALDGYDSIVPARVYAANEGKFIKAWEKYAVLQRCWRLKVLSGVKTLGIVGEISLAQFSETFFPKQYENVATVLALLNVLSCS